MMPSTAVIRMAKKVHMAADGGRARTHDEEKG
jgi:hypothetical protein